MLGPAIVARDFMGANRNYLWLMDMWSRLLVNIVFDS